MFSESFYLLCLFLKAMSDGWPCRNSRRAFNLSLDPIRSSSCRLKFITDPLASNQKNPKNLLPRIVLGRGD
jgi:hypothetical protein